MSQIAIKGFFRCRFPKPMYNSITSIILSIMAKFVEV